LFKQYGEPSAKIEEKHHLNSERFYEILTRIMQEVVSDHDLENQIKTLKQRLIQNKIKLYTTL